jgi:isocitrate lyase
VRASAYTHRHTHTHICRARAHTHLHTHTPQVSWSSDKPRTREGYYRINGGLDFGCARGVAFAPYADLVWMETKSPSLKEAKKFSDAVLGVYPKQMLCYNNSPSFNWDAAGMTSQDMQSYIWQLGKMGCARSRLPRGPQSGARPDHSPHSSG